MYVCMLCSDGCASNIVMVRNADGEVAGSISGCPVLRNDFGEVIHTRVTKYR